MFILVLVASILVVLIILPVFNYRLPKWFCDNLGWHMSGKAFTFDGCSVHSQCPRCSKEVMQDSQGNWF